MTLSSQITALREDVLAARPALRSIFERHGTKSLAAYAREYYQVPVVPFFAARQGELVATIRDEAERIAGSQVAATIATQLERAYMANTADHLGPISQTYFVNSNIVNGLAMRELGWENGIVLVLAAGNVAFNNASFARGLLYHSDTLPDSAVQRVLIVPNNAKPNLVYGYPAYTNERIEQVRHDLLGQVDKKTISRPVAQRLSRVLEEVYADPEAFRYPYYSEQVSYTNQRLWRQFFQPQPQGFPGLLYLEIEQIAVRLFLDHHLEALTPLHELVFNPAWQAAFQHHFDGLTGAFSTAENWGTVLFWVAPHGRHQRMPLTIQGDRLVTPDGSWSVTCTPEEIRPYLDSRELFPSLALVFCIIAFYYGLTCLGGFSQTTYLGQLKEAYAALLEEVGVADEAAGVRQITTDLLCDNFSVAYLETADGRHTVATGLDLILYGNEHAFERIATTATSVTVQEAMDTMLPDSYRYLHPVAERDSELATITEEQIIQHLNLEQKVQLIGTIHH